MSEFAAGKLLDFFRHYDPARPQHVEGVRRLERSLRDKAPELLTDDAYWVQGWRHEPAPPKPPEVLSVDLRGAVRPQAQSNSISCGQASVAMAVHYLTGKAIRDTDIDARYGFALLEALQRECPQHNWRDAGNLSSESWPSIMRALSNRCPVIVGLNGPQFSPSGRGHIVLIVGLVANGGVWFADPAYGSFRRCTRRDMESAPPHPDGKFIFLASPR